MRLLLICFSVFITFAAAGQKSKKTVPPKYKTAATFAAQKTTDQILHGALIKAQKENKNIFVIFHASWCGWCHRMDSAMNDKTVKPYFDKNFVVKHLVVYESEKRKSEETPGALELLTRYAGQDLGIPYWLVFDKTGALIADSQRKTGENVGCPASQDEVEYFIEVLKKTSAITPQQIAAVQTRFRKNER